MSKINKIFIIAFLVVGITGLLIWLTIYFTTDRQKHEITKLEQNIDFLKQEFVPIRFKIIEKNGDNLLVAAKFYDGDENVINKTEFELEGNELSFDFITIKIAENKYISFPYKVYTDKIAPVDGKLLFEYYETDEFPQIFYQQEMNNNNIKALKKIFKKIKENDFDEEKNFGNMVHDIRNVKSYNIKQIYKIVCRVKGGIEVIEE